MNEDERKALSALRFDSALAPDHVWREPPFHVDGLYGDVNARIRAGFNDARISPDASPIGVAVQGQAGSGKTHLLGWVRRQVQAGDGYFFLVSLIDGDAFWKSTMLSIVDGLVRPGTDGTSQVSKALGRLSEKAEISEQAVLALRGQAPVTRSHLDELVTGLRRIDLAVGLECSDTLRAFALLCGADMKSQDIGYSYLMSREETELGERAAWGIRPEAQSEQMLIRDVFRLLALTGPSAVAVDQIDTIVAQAATTDTTGAGADSSSPEQLKAINQIADGLMSLREITRRTLTIVACLPSTWILIADNAVRTVRDRFQEAKQINRIPSLELGKKLVARRFGARFIEVGFTPPYDTWPVRPEAFDNVIQFRPRDLIRRINSHIESCLDSGAIRELWSFDGREVSPHTPKLPPPATRSALDILFEQLVRNADVQGALVPDSQDKLMPPLLAAGLTAWIEEQDQAPVFRLDPLPGSKPALHARLRQTLDDSTDDEQHWAFRAICHDAPIAALNRIQAARTAAGLSPGITKRKLFLLRNTSWSRGPKTQAAISDFSAAGGTLLPISEDDLRIFTALKTMLATRDPDLHDWLIRCRPASQTTLFTAVLGEAASKLATEPVPEPKAALVNMFESAAHAKRSIILGQGLDDGASLEIELESLRKHTAIFAGSGSGKTVLIRRLLEECALEGVSSIVLDPNNDLARLGDVWPQTPAGWLGGDAEKAEEFHKATDVVVWTPRWEGGRALSFQPLPDFASVVADVDEFNIAIDAAVASLAPRAKVEGTTAKASRGRAVLTEALRSFARQNHSGIRAFIEYLSELANGVSSLEDATKIAFEMSQNLTAAMVNDPLFGGGGAPVDPGLLLTPAQGKRARISVISFVGLPSDDQRQSFVNQLQMALFAWIKRNPAGERPLGGLFVMDEAQTLAPSGAMTACTQSTLALASQARKYGLGLVFATQAPKGLHNRIPGNAATQFFGLLNAPVQIEAAREMAQAKAGDVSDISRLRTGQFYASSETVSFQKVQTPLCLSYHPRSPLTTEEVVERARRA